MEKIEKLIKDAKGVSYILFVITCLMTLVSLGGLLFENSLYYSKAMYVVPFIVYLIVDILLIVSIIGYNKRVMYAPILGIIAAIFFIIISRGSGLFTIVFWIAGVGLLIEDILILINFNKNG